MSEEAKLTMFMCEGLTKKEEEALTQREVEKTIGDTLGKHEIVGFSRIVWTAEDRVDGRIIKFCLPTKTLELRAKEVLDCSLPDVPKLVETRFEEQLTI